MDHIVEGLRNAKELNKFTYSDIGALLNVNEHKIKRLFNKQQDIELAMFFDLCTVLGIHPFKLLKINITNEQIKLAEDIAKLDKEKLEVMKKLISVLNDKPT